jgi:aminoglycoside phosphotransferase (APT) family kinase protein
VSLDARCRAWVDDQIGAGAKVVSTKRLSGGMSSVIHEIAVDRGNRERERFILRRVFCEDDESNDPPGEIGNEYRTLVALNGQAKSPVICAADFDGSACGSCASLQTRLPGKPVVAPAASEVDWWIRGLAEATHAIATAATSATVAATHTIRELSTFGPWWPQQSSTPSWATLPRAWERVAKRLRTALPTAAAPRLIHRDLHPGNVLFHRHRFSGIVDWVHACVGPVEVDVSRCRVQIAMLAGLDVADTYLELCRDLVPTYDSGWDAYVAIELSPWVDEIAETFAGIGSTKTPTDIQQVLNHYVNEADTEILKGGINTVLRIAETVVRPTGPHSPGVHALLKHLHDGGFTACPAVIAAGGMPQTETLSFLDGETTDYPIDDAFRTDQALTSAAKLLRQLHDATIDFSVSPNHSWLLAPRTPAEVICHGDFAPYNCVMVDDNVTGVFDFDTAHPGPRIADVGYAAYRWVPLTAPTNSDGWGSQGEQQRRLALFCDTYGIDVLGDIAAVLRATIERLTAMVADIKRFADNGSEAFQQHLDEGHDRLYLDDVAYIATLET